MDIVGLISKRRNIVILVVLALGVVSLVTVRRDRLPGAGAPISYSLVTNQFASRLTSIPEYELTCTLSKSLRQFNGTLRVSVPASYTQGSEVVFHVPPNYARSQAGARKPNMRVEEVSLDGEAAQVRDEVTLLRVNVPADRRGKKVVIQMAFSAEIPELKLPATFVEASMQQLLKQFVFKGMEEFYGLYSYANDVASLANWHPTLAVHQGGDADTFVPGNLGDITHFEVGNYRVELSAPVEVVVVTSGSLVSSATKGDYSTYHYVGAGLREFTINASPLYRSLSRKVGDTNVHSYYLAKDARAGKRALDVAVECLELFNRSFGAYPFRDLNIVEAPIGGSAGGMEYSGLVTVAQQFYSEVDLSTIPILKKLNLGPMDSRMEAMLESQLDWVVAHEVAHQWWHGIVGNNEKELPFVDESLTNFSTYYYMESKHGKEQGQQIAFQQLHFVYQLHRLNGGSDQSLAQGVSSFTTPMAYGAQIYSKGALHYIALRHLLGDAHFFAVLREYVRKNAFSIVGIKEFDSVLEEYLVGKRENVLLQRARDLRQRWLYGTYGDADIGTFSLTSAMEAFLGPKVFAGPEGAQRRLIFGLFEPVIMQGLRELSGS